MYIWNRTFPCPCIKYLASGFEVDSLVVYLTILQHNNIHVVELDVEPNLFNLIFDLICKRGRAYLFFSVSSLLRG